MCLHQKTTEISLNKLHLLERFQNVGLAANTGSILNVDVVFVTLIAIFQSHCVKNVECSYFKN